MTFVVFLLSMLLLAVQIASSQLTPRIIATAFRNVVIRRTVSYFVFGFIFAVGTHGRVGPQVPEVAVLCTIILCLGGVVVAFYLVDYMAKSLRPVSVVASAASRGVDVIEHVYPRTLGDSAPHESQHDESQAQKPDRIVQYGGRSGVFLAFDATGLAKTAAEAGCRIQNVPAVGDFVSNGDALFHVYGDSGGISDQQFHQHVAMGDERTSQQDPCFVFRIIVDIASRALSPAINDPTTAVMAIDQIHRLLLRVGRRDLGDGMVRDAAGQLRLVFPTPNWEDFVALGVAEIRLYGATSIQVLRRLPRC